MTGIPGTLSTAITETTTALSEEARSSRRVAAALALALALLSGAYLLHMAGPLRLNLDAIVLLSMADEASRGAGFTYHGKPTQFPPGYPFLITLLDRAGVAAPWSLVGMNLLFLGAGLFALDRVQRRTLGLSDAVSAVLCGLVLLSYLFVKHAALPLSDVPFFGVCACAIALMSACHRDPLRFWPLWAAAAAVTAAAISVRLAGIALAPPLLWPVVVRFIPRRGPSGKRARRTVALGLAVALVTLAASVSTTRYFRETINALTNDPDAGGLIPGLVLNSWMRLTDGGEAFLNVPASKAPQIDAIYPFVGIALIVMCIAAIWGYRRSLGPVEVFVVSYLVLLFGYVGYDARYWMPVLPFAAALGARALAAAGVHPRLRAAGLVYAAWVLATGLAALTYSARVSMAGERFPGLYGDGTLSDTYRVALGWAGPEEASNVNPEALYLLRRYGSGR